MDRVQLSPPVIGRIPRTPPSAEQIPLPFADVPSLLIRTLLSVEDRHFNNHMGINPFSMIRALWVNVKGDRIRQGGSTLTQQLVKNQILSPRPTLKRKLREIALALVLERIHDKRTILAWYMNTVWMGRDHASDILGFAAAARVYFGSELKHLTPGEIALLVGMLKGPSAYDPRRFPQKAGARRNQVLDIMARCGILSRSDSEAEKRKPIRVIKSDGVESRFPAYLDLVKRELREIGSLAPGP